MTLSLSVVIPCFGAGAFLAETLRSVLAQRRAVADVLVVDDASPDDSVAVARSFAPRVRVLENRENAGPGARRNQGAAAASGNCLAFLDADDLWEPGHTEKVLGLLERCPEAGLAFSRTRLFGSRQEVWPFRIPCDGEPRDCFAEEMRNHFAHLGAVVVRREVFDRVGGFDDIVAFHEGRRVQAEDFDFVLRAALETPFVGTSEITFRYRWHPGMSSVHRAPQIIMAHQYRLRLIEQMQTNPSHAPRVPVAVERMQRCWQEHLEERWAARAMADVRRMVAFGLRQPALSTVTQAYRSRANVPGGLLRAWDRLHGRAPVLGT